MLNISGFVSSKEMNGEFLEYFFTSIQSSLKNNIYQFSGCEQ
jgi:hypothetical protein